MKKTVKVTARDIMDSLPDAPSGYHHSVEVVSPLVHRVWLHHHAAYDYACGEPVKTVYCFIKGGKVYPPKNANQARPKSVCLLVDLVNQSPYTTIIPKVTSLVHLL